MAPSSPTHQPATTPASWSPVLNRLPSRPFSASEHQAVDKVPNGLQSRPFFDPLTQQAGMPSVQTHQDDQERHRISEWLDLTKIDLFAGSRSASAPPPVASLQRSDAISGPEAEVDEDPDEIADETLQRKCSACAAADGIDAENTIQAKGAIGQPNHPLGQEADRVAADEVEKLHSPGPPQVVNPIAQRAPIQAKSLVQRQSGVKLEASDAVEQEITNTKGQGRSLEDPVRQPMEQAFGADFSGVRIHTDGRSDALNQAVQAKAFTTGQDIYFRSGAYEPGSRSGQELLAHELTHTIQQTGGNTFQAKLKQTPDAETSEGLQAKAIANTISPEGLQTKAIANTISPEGLQTKAIANTISPLNLKTLPPKVNEEETVPAKQLDGDVLAQQADNQHDASGRKSEASIQPKAISGLESVTAVNKIAPLRRATDNPESQEEDSKTQPIQAKPIQAKSIDALPQHHINQASRPVDGKLIQQKMAVSAAPVGVQRSGGGVSWIMRQVGTLLKKLPGFGLLSTLLGKNPVTGEAVERSATSVIGGILKFIGKDDLFQKLKESNAIETAFAWFSQQITKLNLTWDVIRGLFSKAWNALSSWDLLKPVTAFNKIAKIFSAPLQRIRTFAASVIGKVGEFIFEGAMKLAGGAGQRVMGILKQAGGVIGNILKNPVGFVGNLINAIKGGFQAFAANIGTHLKTGLMGWLFGALAGAGLTLPQAFNPQGMIDIVLQVVGATYQNLRQMLVEKIGEKRVAQLEKAFEFVKMLATEGLAGAWQKIMEFAGNLQEMVIGGIKNWVMESVVGAAIRKLVAMFTPAGALIQAAMSIYNAIMFFVEQAQQIAVLASSVFSSISKIAAGNVGAAIGFIEQSMARTLPVIISFLARQVGLGDVAGAIKGIIGKVRGVVQGAIGKLVNFVVGRAKGLLGKTRSNQDSDANEPQAAERQGEGKPGDGEVGETVRFNAGGGEHRLWINVQGTKTIVMVASEEDSVEKKLTKWSQQVDTLPGGPDGKRQQAEKLIDDARQQLGATDQNAQIAAKEMQEAQQSQSDTASAKAIQADNQTEAKQKILASTLGKLFELFEEKGEDPFVGALALYRGIHFKSTLNLEQYDEQLKKSLVGQPTFSSAARSIVGSKEPDGSDIDSSQLEEAAEKVQKEVAKTRDTGRIRQWWSKKEQTFDNLFLAMIQDYINRYNKFDEELKKAQNGHYSGLTFAEIPFISTSKKAQRAAIYALAEAGIIKSDEERTSGTVGRVFVYLFTIQELAEQGAVDVQALQTEQKIKVRHRLLKEGEVTFAGSIPGSNLISQHDAKKGDSSPNLASTAEQSAKQQAQAMGGLKEWLT